MIPTLRQLRYFLTVMETRNFSRAAEICCVTQSTLSGGISELESILGVSLFERTKRKVLPTQAGVGLAKRARRILEEVDGLIDASKAMADPYKEPLRLGIIPTIAPFLLPQIVPLIQKGFPELTLILREDQTARLLNQLSNGDLDLLILAFPYETPDAEQSLFMDDPFWLACSQKHALAKCRSITPNEVPEEDLLLLEDGHCLRDHALAACQMKGGSNEQAIQGTSLYTLLQMVSSNLGITLVPQMAIDTPFLSGLKAAYIPMSIDAPSRQIGFAWRKTTARRPLFDELTSLLKRELSKIGGKCSKAR